MIKLIFATCVVLLCALATANADSPLYLNTNQCASGATPLLVNNHWYCSTNPAASGTNVPMHINGDNATSAALGDIASKTSPIGAMPVVTTSGSTQRTLSVRFDTPVNVLDFGAVCDGSTDDTTAVTNAIAASVVGITAGTLGKPVTSNSKTCGVSGNIILPNGIFLQDIKFKQLDPESISRTTLRKTTGSGTAAFVRVSVNRNGATAISGSVSNKAGIYLSASLSNIYMEDVEVTGNGTGSGIIVENATGLTIVRPYIHDMQWTNATDPGIEQIVGILVDNSTDVSISGHVIKNLTGQIGANPVRAYQTDGIDIAAGTTNATVALGNTSNVSEGIDVSGSGTRTNVWLYGNTYSAIGAAGEKFCHTTVHSGTIGARVYDAGIWGYLVCGGSTGDPGPPNDIRIIDAQAYNTGSNGDWSSRTDIAGFAIIDGNDVSLRATNIQILNPIATDTGNTMLYGYYIIDSTKTFIDNARSTGFVTAYGRLDGVSQTSLPSTRTSATSGLSPTGTTSATAVMMGMGSSAAFTPRYTGKVKISWRGSVRNTADEQGGTVTAYYGTGTAPSNGDATTGTQITGDERFRVSTASGFLPFSYSAVVSGLTVGTQIWADLSLTSSDGVSTSSLFGMVATFEELR